MTAESALAMMRLAGGTPEDVMDRAFEDIAAIATESKGVYALEGKVELLERVLLVLEELDRIVAMALAAERRAPGQEVEE